MDRRLYLKHFAMLFSGAVAGQLVNLASYPLLARLYSPAAFGAFATFIAATAIPASIACLRFDLVVPTAPRWGRFAILWLCTLISAVAGLLCIVGSALYWLAVEGAFNPLLPVLFGLTIFITGFCLTAPLYLMRYEQYRSASVSAVARTGATVVAQLGFGLVSPNSLSLIVGSVLGLVVQGLILSWSIWKVARPRPPRRSHMLAIFRRYRRQVAVDIPGTVIAIGSLNMPTFVIAAVYGQRIVGYYGFAQRIALLPLQLFNDSLSQVFFQKAARARERTGHFWPELRFNLIAMSLVAVATMTGIWVLARPVIDLYLGRQWTPVATMLMVLAPMLGIRTMAYSILPAIYVLRRVHWRVVHVLIEAGLHLACLVAAIWLRLSPIEYLILFSTLFAIEWLRFLVQMIVAARRLRESAVPA